MSFLSDAPARARHRPPPARRRRIIDAGFLIVSALAVAGATACWFLRGEDVFWRVLGEDSVLLLSVLPKLAAGVLIAAMLPFVLDSATVSRWVGPERGIRGLAIAGLAGALIPGGPGITLPMAVGLGQAGADRAAQATFVTGWILFSANRTLVWELSFLPTELVLFRIALCLPAPVLIGLLIRWTERRVR